LKFFDGQIILWESKVNLLFTRSQTRSSIFSLVPLRIGGTVTFKLKTELELTDEETSLLRKYSLSNATLIYSNAYDDLARSFRPAWLLGLITALLTAVYLKVPIDGIKGILLRIAAVPSAGILCVIVMTLVYFFALRKEVTVSQLTDGGRTFYCHSVVELDEQEEELLDLARRLEITLEKAKNWGGREINPLPEGEPYYLPDKEQRKAPSRVQESMFAAGQNLGSIIKRKPATATNNPAPTPPTNLPKHPSPAPQTSTEAKAPAHPFAPKPPEPPQDGS